MERILNASGKNAILFCLAFVMKRLKYFDHETGVKGLQLIVNYMVPMAIIVSVPTVELNVSWLSLPLLCVCHALASIPCCYMLHKVILTNLSRQERGQLMMCSMGQSVALIGAPLASSFYGAAGLARLALFDVTNFPLAYVMTNVCAIMFMNLDDVGGQDGKSAMRDAVDAGGEGSADMRCATAVVAEIAESQRARTYSESSNFSRQISLGAVPDEHEPALDPLTQQDNQRLHLTSNDSEIRGRPRASTEPAANMLGKAEVQNGGLWLSVQEDVPDAIANAAGEHKLAGASGDVVSIASDDQIDKASSAGDPNKASMCHHEPDQELEPNTPGTRGARPKRQSTITFRQFQGSWALLPKCLMLRNVLKQPPAIGVFLGFLLKIFGIVVTDLPRVLQWPLLDTAQMAGSFTFFTLGMFFEPIVLLQRKYMKRLAVLLVIRYTIAIATAVCFWLVSADSLIGKVGCVCVLMPIPPVVITYSVKMGYDVHFAAAAVNASLVLSFVLAVACSLATEVL